ncbi:tetratricopeptide repeat protein [Pyxidicoccus parkwayensis]|uniref:tetratricopeptide repeat protein n=1 Tax=Pyxidicoccus parkwayensis TaxID=2813578 RepID=UPI001F5078B4|nr:tetratricopeptide repeat protein [Pyxidicoccus parkwaysis]
MAHIIVARSGDAATLERLPPQLRTRTWPEQKDTAALKTLALELLARSPLSLGERLSQVENLATLRTRLLAETAIPSPRLLAGIPQFPYDLEPSIQHRFVGRENELWRIDLVLSLRSGEPSAAALTTGLEGGGGVGKTRLALEYFHRFGPRRFPGGLFWVDADVSDNRLEEQLHGILRELDPSAPPLRVFREQELPVSKALAQALNRQAPGRPILYVVDNIPEPPAGTPPGKLQTWCPAPSKVALLVTSRFRFSIADKSLAAVQVDSLSPESAVLLLTDGVGTTALQPSEWEHIAAWVGHLPLALQLLNGAMTAGGLSPAELLARSRTEGITEELDRQMEALHGTVSADMLRGVTEAFLLSYRKLSSAQQLATRLLAQLAPDPIPDAMLNQLGPGLMTAEIRNSLRARSFVGPAGSGGVPLFGVMHRVLADFLRGMADDFDAELHQACEALIRVMGQADAADTANWPLLNACLPHAEQLFERAEASSNEVLARDAIRLGLGTSGFLAERGLPREALRLGKRVLAQAEELLGTEHPLTLSAKGNLGLVMHEASDARGALALQEQVRDAYTRTVGPEHPDTLVALNNLAGTLEVLGEVDRALQYLEQVVSVRRRILGDAHLDTLVAINNLATLLQRAGRTREARALQQQLLEQQTPLLGEEHPHTLKAKSNLGRYILEDTSNRDEKSIAQARSIFESVLTARRRLLGERHPDTLEALSNLAAAIFIQGDPRTASELQEKALALLVEVLGEHSYVALISRRDLAETLKALNDYRGARTQYERALASSKLLHGPKHPTTTFIAWQLFEMCCALRDDAGADSVLNMELRWLLDQDPEQLPPEQQEIGLRLVRLSGIS